MKKLILSAIIIIVLIAGGFWLYVNKVQKDSSSQQVVLEQTLALSRQYFDLSSRTDKVLSSPKSYGSYETWNEKMTSVINDWNRFENDALALENSAQKFSISKSNFNFELTNTAFAFDKQEVTDIFDKAPAGKKIATLAKQLGVDAKRASLILQQAQNELTADAYNEAGNSLRKLEVAAIAIKDGAKVAGFIGGIAVTGGVSAVAVGTTLAKTAIVVSGADLVLEVSDDASKIALGDGNKVSEIISSGREFTEPLASILTISDLPGNVKKGFEKFNVVMIALDQFNGAVQEGKIIGIKIPTPEPVKKFQLIAKHKEPIYVSVIEQNEVDDWLTGKETKDKASTSKENNTENDAAEVQLEKKESVITTTTESIKTNLEVKPKPAETTKEPTASEAVIKDFSLLMKPAEATNDWQAAIKLFLFSKAPLQVKNDVFNVSYSGPFSFGQFVGSGEIKINGKYDKKTGILSGTHYRKYEGLYKEKPQTIIYSGSFSQKISIIDTGVKIKYAGTTQSTSLDGAGKPYTTNSESAVFIEYNIK